MSGLQFFQSKYLEIFGGGRGNAKHTQLPGEMKKVPPFVCLPNPGASFKDECMHGNLQALASYLTAPQTVVKGAAKTAKSQAPSLSHPTNSSAEGDSLQNTLHDIIQSVVGQTVSHEQPLMEVRNCASIGIIL
jgi:hypothetical protein